MVNRRLTARQVLTRFQLAAEIGGVKNAAALLDRSCHERGGRRFAACGEPSMASLRLAGVAAAVLVVSSTGRVDRAHRLLMNLMTRRQETDDWRGHKT